MARRAASTHRAKRILAQAAPHVGRDVIVIAPGVEGTGYLASSLPLRTAAEIHNALVLAEEAVKKLRHWHRRARRVEAKAAAAAEE